MTEGALFKVRGPARGGATPVEITGPYGPLPLYVR